MPRTASQSTRVTSLADIAQACGVTKATVSRVLNDKPGFTQELQDKIHKVAARLNYRPSGLARSLRRNKTPIVMVLGFHARWMTSPEPPIYGRLIHTCTNTLYAQNMACMLDMAVDDDLSPQWSSLTPDGALVIPPLNGPRLEKLTRDRIPFVLVNEKGPDDVSSVYTDDHVSMRIAMEHLIKLGHRRIAYMNQNHFDLGFQYHSSLMQRMASYTDIMQQHGLAPIPGYDQAMSLEVFFREVILEHRPTAVVCYKSSCLKTIHELCLEHGMRVPTDISLVGFDKITPKFEDEFEFTCVDIPMEELGVHAARILGQKLNNPNYHETQCLESKLLIRQSTAPVSNG